MNDKWYVFYLKSGNVVEVLANSFSREDEYTNIYKMVEDGSEKGKKYIVARFENVNIEGFVIKGVNADDIR